MRQSSIYYVCDLWAAQKQHDSIFKRQTAALINGFIILLFKMNCSCLVVYPYFGWEMSQVNQFKKRTSEW